MARFDVYSAGGEGPGFWLDCQADILNHLSHRLVVPLIPVAQVPPPMARLNPVFSVDGVEVVMMTHFASAVPVRELGALRASLAHEHDRVMQALDMLLTGI